MKRPTPIELLVVCGIIVLLASIVIPTRQRLRQTSGRVRCASNLKQIGMAMLLYAVDNQGRYPRTTYIPGAPVCWGTEAAATDPFGTPGPSPNDVTSAMFLLVRTQDISPSAFTCEMTDATPDPLAGGGAQQRSNFTDVNKHLSYSFQNPYPAGDMPAWWWTKEDARSTFAYASDKNPGTEGGDDDVLGPTTRTTRAAEQRRANTNNNGGEGQNVLYSDGHVEFNQTPFCGTNDDNIFTTRARLVVGPPIDVDDSILLPTDD